MAQNMEAIIVKHDEGQLGFIRYTILVTLGDQSWSIVRRFSDFAPFQEALHRAFPYFQGHLPPKKWFGRFHMEFLRDRKVQLQQYLDAVTGLPGLAESAEGRYFFEIDRHIGGDIAGNRTLADGHAPEDAAPYEQARISAILDDTSHAFINTSSPLYQVSIEQMDPAELAQQRTKLLQRTSGFRGQSSIVHQLSCSSYLQQHQLQRGAPQGVIDILAAPSRMTLGVQAQLLEKQGLCIADELREARQIRTKDGRDLVCQLREERI